jgi:hypothetical protein
MGAFGGAHAGAERLLNKLTAPEAAPAKLAADADPQQHADARLAQAIQAAADDKGFNLKRVNYSAPDGARAALDNVHNDLAERIKKLWGEVSTDLDRNVATNVDDLLERAGLEGIIRSAKNKVKGLVGPDGLQTLDDAVGHTSEGQHLIDLVRQSNSLTNLLGDLKGGVSKITDFLNPLARSGRESGYSARDNGVLGLLHSGISGATRAGEAVGLYHNPALAVPLLAGWAAGRGIDALTGNRSRVARFVRDNSAEPAPLDANGLRSITLDNARQYALEQAMLRAKQAEQLQADQGRNLKRAEDQFNTQQQAAETARLAEREKELRTQNRLDNNPGLGGYDRAIYDQIGVRPNDVVPGVFELFRTGRITPSEFHGFFEDPKSLMAGNAGNHIIDMLDMMARRGQLPRDPEWQAGSGASEASARPDQPQVSSVYNPAAYEAQAAGNQARVTEAQARVAASEHSPEVKGGINDAIAAIGRTNNRQDAAAVRDNLVQSLAKHSPDAARLAHQELSPLVSQIRHATPESAGARSVPKGADLRPLTEDVTRDGNSLTRTLAASYKHKAGISKPAYDGKREPDKAYLTAVAQFHDQAVHSPNDPAVKSSYAALARETIAQFKSLGGLKVETWRGEGEPYRNSKEMMRDVADNHHLWFLPTDTAFGSGDEIAHPMLAPTGLKTVDGHPLLVNDVFRIVHDFYGHTQHGFQFGPVGEYNAFREHAQMYSDAALPALAAETLAQNAWVNFGPHSHLPVTERPFSDQKAYAFPRELLTADPNVGREFIDAYRRRPWRQDRARSRRIGPQ